MTDALIHRIVRLGEENTSPDVVVELMGYLSHSDGNVRRLACSALGKLRVKEAERPLANMLDDEKPQVRQYALKALEGVATPFVLPALRRVVSTTEEQPYNLAIARMLIDKLEKPLRRAINTSAPVISHSLDLSVDQKRVIDTLRSWILRPKGEFITVGGYAGTGKTTIAAVLRTTLHRDHPKLRVAFACFTGKASQVLKNKLIDQKAIFYTDTVGTLHSLMYKPRLDSKGHIKGWSRVPDIEADRIVIDEASMVTAKMWEDIRSYGVPIIAIGDHGQLPPVGDEYSLMQKPQLCLETIHRHALDNPILKVATLARTTGVIPFDTFSPTVRKVHRKSEASGEITDRVFRAMKDDTLILCGRNRTRVRLNAHIRTLLGFETDEPMVGEQVICLKNNYEVFGAPIYNGMVGRLLKLTPSGDHWYEAEIRFRDEERLYGGKISRHQFHKEHYVEDVPGIHYRQIGDRFDFGYALTVHKSQGSQADRVLLFEEQSPYWEGELWNRWLYTAVTRAVKELYIVG